ncbi:GGDEF domain-containing protein [Gayadomonas joobiniege]|uniref:sensor domain-containing diguanylate cyclase n=1 Tax=Gayadomonas joobiniege TaxID=1234606 RepID=UPI000371DBB9|nr:GGDEF domain-containing protein [Gayadomonas joobiniege]
MKLRYYLIIIFIFFTSVQTILNLYLFKNYQKQLITGNVASISQIELNLINASADLFDDTVNMIASRTSLIQAVVAWQQHQDVEAKNNINDLILDTYNSFNLVKWIQVYDDNGQIITYAPRSNTIQPLNYDYANNMVAVAENQKIVLRIEKPLISNQKTIGSIEIAFNSNFIHKIIARSNPSGLPVETVLAARMLSSEETFVTFNTGEDTKIRSASLTVAKDSPIGKAQSGQTGVWDGVKDESGRKLLASTHYLDELQLAVIGQMEVSELDALINKNSQQIFKVYLYAAFTAILFYWLIAANITRPLVRVSENAKRIVKNNHIPLYQPNYISEINQLQDSLIKMAKNLKKKQKNTHDRHQAQTKQLKLAANLDPLTGLYNRRVIDTELPKEINRALRYQHPLSLAMVDLDHFKQVNDTYGHCAGDQVLSAVAKHLIKNVRKTDSVMRFGGEEFCILMPSSDLKSSFHLLNRLRLGIAELTTFYQAQNIRITASFGLTALSETNDTSENLIEQADQALYKAKQNGRNQVICYQQN